MVPERSWAMRMAVSLACGSRSCHDFGSTLLSPRHETERWVDLRGLEPGFWCSTISKWLPTVASDAPGTMSRSSQKVGKRLREVMLGPKTCSFQGFLFLKGTESMAFKRRRARSEMALGFGGLPARHRLLERRGHLMTSEVER